MAFKSGAIQVAISGPLFETSAPQRLEDATAEFLKATGIDGARMLAGNIRAGGFVKSGRFADSSTSEQVRTRGIGYVKDTVTDAWPTPHRPTRTWMERGTRRPRAVNGLKSSVKRARFRGSSGRLAQGVYAFRNTRAAINGLDLSGMALKAVTPVLQ